MKNYLLALLVVVLFLIAAYIDNPADYETFEKPFAINIINK